VLLKPNQREWEMTNMNRILIALICAMGLAGLASAQNAAPAKVSPADAKNHVGDTVTVCGKVVDTKISKYGVGGRGKPVLFYIDQPEAEQIFYFVAFGSKDGGPDEVLAAYKGKSVCVTGKVSTANGQPYIMAADRSSIKPNQ
jgi:hypothetical protein